LVEFCSDPSKWDRFTDEVRAWGIKGDLVTGLLLFTMHRRVETLHQPVVRVESTHRAEMPTDMLMKTDTLQDSLDKYRAKIGAGGRNCAAAYELALASGRNYKPGDQISYYVKATPKKVAAYEAAKLASDFDPQNRDENVDYYVAKLDELVKKFAGVTAPEAKQGDLL
jgi:DNA polymerase I